MSRRAHRCLAVTQTKNHTGAHSPHVRTVSRKWNVWLTRVFRGASPAIGYSGGWTWTLLTTDARFQFTAPGATIGTVSKRAGSSGRGTAPKPVVKGSVGPRFIGCFLVVVGETGGGCSSAGDLRKVLAEVL